jgi:hypothetical protein
MKRFCGVSLMSVISLSAMVGSQFTLTKRALAVEPDFRISVTAARAAMVNEKSKAGDSKEVETKSSKLYTMSDGGVTEFAISWEGNGIYLLPFSSTGTVISYGKSLSDTMELGVQVGLNGMTEKVGDATETKNSGYRLGLTYWGSMPLAGNSMEVSVNPYLSFGNSEKETPSTTGNKLPVKEEVSMSSLALFTEAIYVVPLKKNFDYAAGADLTFASGEMKTKLAGGTELKTKKSSFELGLILARFRARF